MFFQNARDAIKVIKRSFAEPTDPVGGGIIALGKEFDDLIAKYEALKVKYE